MKKQTIFDGMTMSHKNRLYRVNIESDDDYYFPWIEHDGCGIVIRQSQSYHNGGKRPGWVPLNDHSRGEYKFYYDWQGTIQKARSEGWGLSDSDTASLAVKLNKPVDQLTKGEIVAEAVRKNFERMQGYLTGSWHYVGVVVTDITDDENAKTDYTFALLGIESDCDEYMLEVANELASENYRQRKESHQAEVVSRWNARKADRARKAEANRWTLDAGRCICRDGLPFVTIHKCDGVTPTDADEFTRRIVAILRNEVNK